MLKDQSAILLSLLICGFWLLSKYFNVYRYAITGAIYELLALPMLLLAFIWPIYLIVRGLRNKSLLKPSQLLSILIFVATLIVMILSG